jgi:hypothetical protein
MVSGKPSNQSARQVDSSPTTQLLIYVYTHNRMGIRVVEQPGLWSCSRATDICPAHWMCVWSAVACGGIVPQQGMKSKRLLRNDLSVFQACELGLPCKG